MIQVNDFTLQTRSSTCLVFLHTNRWKFKWRNTQALRIIYAEFNISCIHFISVSLKVLNFYFSCRVLRLSSPACCAQWASSCLRQEKPSYGSVHLDSAALERGSGFRELERRTTLQRCGRHWANRVKELERRGKIKRRSEALACIWQLARRRETQYTSGKTT